MEISKFSINFSNAVKRLCCLLHNGNMLSSIGIRHSGKMTENSRNLKRNLSAMKYNQHNWAICVDLKAVSYTHLTLPTIYSV